MTNTIFYLNLFFRMSMFVFVISSTDIAAQQDQQTETCDMMVLQLSQTASVDGNGICT